VHNILHADDTPHAIALGASIATFIAILPIIGMQTIVSVALAAMFRANKAVCFPIVWISNPLTAVPIYYPCFLLGRFVLASPQETNAEDVLGKLTLSNSSAGIFEARFWEDLFFTLVGLGVEIWVGSLIVAAVLAILAYPFSRWAVNAYRERHRQRMLRRELFLPRMAAERAFDESEAA
jgi:hypothetical protein